MPRAKRGVAAHKRHKKILALAKGHRGGRHNLYRQAHESVLHALDYAYNDRRDRKHDMRRLWIARIGAACRLHSFTYSRLIAGLQRAAISLDRKVLADMAVREPAAFAAIVEQARAAL